MNYEELRHFLFSQKKRIDYVLDNVIARGYDDVEEEFDDYNVLIEKYEFREIIAFELYENYFLPKRHEFELQLLKDVIDAIVESKGLIFTLAAAAGGVIGGGTYDLVRKLFEHIAQKFKNADTKRAKIFKNIKDDVSKIEKYFKKNGKATISQLEEDLKIERNRLVPLLKLLGFKCQRRKKKSYWLKP